MATPRSQLVDPTTPMYYHLVSRCVRQSWLCGRHPISRRNYGHRRQWLIERIESLTPCFAVAVEAYAIMSNHFHLVVHFDPLASQRWSDDEVARRWLTAFPPRASTDEERNALRDLARDQILESPERLLHARRTLGSLSGFMKHLKQPIAWRANREDQCTGHFFEGRFYSGALLDDNAVLAAMAYVDLNPVRARIARTIEQCIDSSISRRLRHLANSAERLQAALAPLVTGLDEMITQARVTLRDYIDHLRSLTESDAEQDDKLHRWRSRVSTIRKRQRAHGNAQAIEHWTKQRNWKRSGVALI